MHVKYAFRHWLYSVPNVFVTLVGATVTLRAVSRPERATVLDAARDCVVAVRAIVLFDVPRDVADVAFGVVARATVVVAAARDLDVVRVFCAFVVAVRETVVAFVRAVVFLVTVGWATVAVRPVVRAITVWVSLSLGEEVVRFIAFVPRTTAPASAMLMQQAAIKNRIFLISCYLYNDNKNIFL